MVGGLTGLIEPEQLLVQLLAGTQARVHDSDRDRRLASESVRDVVDPHGLTHVEDEHVPVGADGAGLDDELHGFLDGHEVAGDVGCVTVSGSAGLDLGPERGEHRAAAAEHVAESHAQVAVGPWKL